MSISKFVFCGLLIGWVGMAGCDQRPAATVATEVEVPSYEIKQPGKRSAGTAAASARVPTGDSAAGAFAVLFEPLWAQRRVRADSIARTYAAWAKSLTETKTVAPGLRVLIRPIPVAGTVADWPEPGALHLTFTIERNGQVVYQDTTDDELTYFAVSEPQAAQLYPRWVPTTADTGDLLVAFSRRPSMDQVRRFQLAGQHVAKIDTLPLFYGPAKNLDADADLEYAGVWDYGETWDGEQPGQRWTSYVPMLYYEIRPTGLALDSALTQQMNRQIYGKFRGYQYSEKPGIPAATAGPRRAQEIRRITRP